MRRSVVGGMALVMLVALMGTAAAVGSPVLPGGMVDEAGSDGLRDQPQPTPADPSGHARGGAGAEDTEDGDRPFGLRRSQEARRFGQCMRDSGGDRSACDDLKPGPAWTTPGHPGQGHGRW